MRYVGKVATPTMLVHGENDNDVPLSEAEQFFIALKDVGVETVFVRYPAKATAFASRNMLLTGLTARSSGMKDISS